MESKNEAEEVGGYSQGDSQQDTQEEEGGEFESQNASYEEGVDSSSREYVQNLRQCWINERCCPELLFYEDVIVNRVKELLEEQQELVLNAKDSRREELLATVTQMELDRVQFMLTAYLRTRISKIERYVVHILTDPEIRERVSDAEREYASKFLDILERNFNSSFLDNIPDKFRGLTENESSTGMIPKPNLEAHVFIKVKDDVGIYRINDDNDEVELFKDDILAASYQPFKELLMQDKIDLI